MVVDLIQEFLGDDRLRDRAMARLPQVLEGQPDVSDDAAHLHQSRRDLADARDLRLCARGDPLPNRARPTVYAQWYPFRADRRPASSAAGSRAAAEPGGRASSTSPRRGVSSTTWPRDDRSPPASRDPDWTAGDVYLAMIALPRRPVRRGPDPGPQAGRPEDEGREPDVVHLPVVRLPGARRRSSRPIPRLADEAIALYERATSLPYSLTFMPIRAGPAPHPPADPSLRASGPDRGRTCAASTLGFARNQVPSTANEELIRQYQDLRPRRDGAEAGRPGLSPPMRCRSTARRSPSPSRSRPTSPNYYRELAAVPQAAPRGPRIGPERPESRRAGPDRRPI